MTGEIKQRKSYVSLSSKEFYNLQTSIIGFVGIISVIFIHSNNIGSYELWFENGILSGIVGIIETLIIKLAAVANSYFFMISGYHFYQGISKEKIKAKLFKRIKTLVIPYVIAVSISIIYYFLISIIPGLMGRLGMPMLIWTPKLIVGQFLNPTFDYPLWFVNYLIVFSFLAPALYWGYSKRKISYAVMLFLIVTNVFSLVDNSYYTWFSVYFIGGYIGFYSKKFTNGLSVPRINKYQRHIYVVLAFFSIMLVVEQLYDFSNVVSRVYMYVSPFIIWDVVANNLRRCKKIIQIKWWMKITFFVYSYHVFVLPVITKIIKMILPNNPVIALVSFIISPLFTYVSLIIVAKVIKIKPELWNLINGGRGN